MSACAVCGASGEVLPEILKSSGVGMSAVAVLRTNAADMFFRIEKEQ